MSVNRVLIVGNLGKDPEKKKFNDGNEIVEFSVATNRSVGKEKAPKTTWFQVNTRGPTADACMEYLKKGRSVYVEGHLDLQMWTDKNGKERCSPRIIANNVRFLGGRSDENQ